MLRGTPEVDRPGAPAALVLDRLTLLALGNVDVAVARVADRQPPSLLAWDLGHGVEYDDVPSVTAPVHVEQHQEPPQQRVDRAEPQRIRLQFADDELGHLVRLGIDVRSDSAENRWT
jgi:hypothetical protein